LSRSVLGVVCVALLVAVSPASAQTRPEASRCSVSSDPEYGLTREKAIRIGGGPFTHSAREKRYLSLLRDPQGQPVQVAPGVGSGFVDGVIIDSYSVTVGGKSVSVHFNAYRFETLQAPQGFSCAGPLSAIGPPPMEGATVVSEISALGVEQGPIREFAPVPLTDSGAMRAVVFDFFRMVASRARNDVATGKTIAPPPGPVSVVVAYPFACEGAAVSATAIDVLVPGPQGKPLQKAPGLASGPKLSTIVGGAVLPEGAVGSMFTIPFLQPNHVVRITYSEAPASCGGSVPKELLLGVRVEPSRLVESPIPALPTGSTEPDPTVFLQALIDTEGAVSRLLFISGPESLRDAAMAIARKWRATPARMNGEPVVTATMLAVTFK
jgi:hypothetical protein